MALTTVEQSASVPFLQILGAPFRAFGRLMVSMMENNSRLKRIERLQSMSDEQLAELGIQRDDIVHHVFKELYAL